MEDSAATFNSFQNDPGKLISTAIHNNLAGLNVRARQYVYTERDLTDQEMYQLIRSMAANGDTDGLQALLSIDYRLNVLPPGNDAFFLTHFSPRFMQRHYRNGEGEGEDLIHGIFTQEEWNDMQAGEFNWSDLNWGNIIQGLGGVVSIFTGWGQEEEAPTPSPGTGSGNGNGNPDRDKFELNTNTALMIGGFVLLVVLLIRRS